HELLAHVVDEDVLGLDASHLRFLSGGRQLLALAEIGGEGHHLAAIGRLQPLQDDRGVEAARVGQHDLLDIALFVGPGITHAHDGPSGGCGFWKARDYSHRFCAGKRAILAERAMVSALDRLSYAARQTARVAWYAGHYAAGRRLLKPMPKPDYPVRPKYCAAACSTSATCRASMPAGMANSRTSCRPAPRPTACPTTTGRTSISRATVGSATTRPRSTTPKSRCCSPAPPTSCAAAP